MALVVQQNLKALNINAEIVTLTQDEVYAYQFGNILDAEGIRDYDCLVTTWGADYPDPSANLDPLFNIANIGASGYNCAAYSNETVDSLLNQAVTTTDESQRMELLFQACDCSSAPAGRARRATPPMFPAPTSSPCSTRSLTISLHRRAIRTPTPRY